MSFLEWFMLGITMVNLALLAAIHIVKRDAQELLDDCFATLDKAQAQRQTAEELIRRMHNYQQQGENNE